MTNINGVPSTYTDRIAAALDAGAIEEYSGTALPEKANAFVSPVP